MPATIEDLRRHLESRPRGDVLELATALLVFCRDHAHDLELLYDDAAVVARRRRAVAAAEPWFERLRTMRLSAAEQEQVRTAIVPAVASRCGDAALTARAMADALDRVFGSRLPALFRARGDRTLAPDEPFLVASPPLKVLFGSGLAGRSASLAERFDAMGTVRLFPRGESNVEVRVRWLDGGRLASLADHVRVGVGLPNLGTAEFGWGTAHREGQALFFPVRPRSSEAQIRRILAIVDRAEAEGLDVLVLPELCACEDVREAVAVAVARCRSLRIVVPGSVHVEREEAGESRRRNLATVWVGEAHGGFVRGEHTKYNRFRHRDGDGTEYEEDIHVIPSALTVYQAGDWSFAVLICKDVLDPRVQALLSELQVRLVLVPSWSGKESGFRGAATGLAASAQAMVVVANLAGHANGDEGPASALFGMPLANRNLFEVGAVEAPGLVTMEFPTTRSSVKIMAKLVD